MVTTIQEELSFLSSPGRGWVCSRDDVGVILKQTLKPIGDFEHHSKVCSTPREAVSYLYMKH